MAGKTRYNAVAREIERRARAEDITPLEYVTARVEDGGTFTKLAAELTRSGFEASRWMVKRYVATLDGWEKALDVARVEGAFSNVERATEILENCEPVREEIQLASKKVDLLLWQAERLNKKVFGPANAAAMVNVNVDLGSLHLNAMVSAGKAAQRVITAESKPEIPAAEFTVED